VTPDYRRRLVWLIAARVVVSTLLLGSAVVFQIAAPGSLPIDPFFFLIGLTYCLSIVYAVTVPYVARHPWVVAAQFVCDVAVVTAFIHFTGGITSYFQLLYVLPVVGASSLVQRREALRVALLSAVLYGALVLYQYATGHGYFGGLRLADMRPFLPQVRVAAFTVVTNAIALVVVALLAGSLAERLRRADARLAVASSALADLQAFSQHVIDSLTSGLATTDPQGALVTFNRAAETITGRRAAEVLGRNAAEILQFPAEFAGILTAGLGGAVARRADYVYRTPSGASRDLGLAIAHLVTPDGVTGYLLTFQDVTEMRRLEREARHRQRLAAIGEMAAGIAHEIRNPLASMRGSIQVLRSELALSDEQAELMDIVLRESDRLNETIRSFLAYARPQAGVRQPVDLARLLEDAATLLRNSPERRPDHAIEVDAPAGGLAIEADEHQIRQVVWNLATNGLKAMPAGGTLRLTARPADEHGAALLEVSDAGVGIAPDQLDRLFQPFHGAFGQGSGLGLAIVHRIVTDHQGEIAVESEPGKGTRVRVRVPRDDGSRQ
jgi:two-component system sensor histidine kinase PilS (NtrC family)